MRQRFALTVLIVALLGAVAVAASPERIRGSRLVRDDIDRGAYMSRGEFAVVPNARPYRDVFSEYPQVATYLFAVPHLLARAPDRKTYMDLFTVLMALALGALALVWTALAREVGVGERRVLLLVLPGTLYFVLNRFDVVPALLAVSALYLLVRSRILAAHAILAVAALTKAYPLLYLPLFVAESARRCGMRRALLGLGTFAAVVVAFSAQLALWSGLPAVLSPFAWQLGRDRNAESLFHLVSSALPSLDPVLRPVFMGLQAVLAVAVLIVRPASPRAVVRWAAVITMAFVLFTRFQSPQWIVWITPLVLLGAVTRTELALAVVQDLLTYVYFPLVFDAKVERAWKLSAVLWALTLVRLALVFMLVRDPGHGRRAGSPEAGPACAS